MLWYWYGSKSVKRAKVLERLNHKPSSLGVVILWISDLGIAA